MKGTSLSGKSGDLTPSDVGHVSIGMGWLFFFWPKLRKDSAREHFWRLRGNVLSKTLRGQSGREQYKGMRRNVFFAECSMSWNDIACVAGSLALPLLLSPLSPSLPLSPVLRLLRRLGMILHITRVWSLPGLDLGERGRVSDWVFAESRILFYFC